VRLPVASMAARTYSGGNGVLHRGWLRRVQDIDALL